MAMDIQKLKKIMQEKERQEKAHRPKLEIDMELLEAMKKAEVSNRKIARYFHCSEGTIRNRLKELER